jgi:hypothetical protein
MGIIMAIADLFCIFVNIRVVQFLWNGLLFSAAKDKKTP